MNGIYYSLLSCIVNSKVGFHSAHRSREWAPLRAANWPAQVQWGEHSARVIVPYMARLCARERDVMWPIITKRGPRSQRKVNGTGAVAVANIVWLRWWTFRNLWKPSSLKIYNINQRNNYLTMYNSIQISYSTLYKYLLGMGIKSTTCTL